MFMYIMVYIIPIQNETDIVIINDKLPIGKFRSEELGVKNLAMYQMCLTKYENNIF